MIQPIRKFSIAPRTATKEMAKDKYPVLAIDHTDDEDPSVFMLIADDAGVLTWLNQTEVTVVSIDD